MSQAYNNCRSRSSNQPEQSREGRGNQSERNGNDQQTRVQLRRSSFECSNLQVSAVQFANEPHAKDNQDDVKEQQPVGQKGVETKHHKDHGIVAGEVAQVVVDARLHLAKVGRLGQALEVKKLGDGPEVGEAAAQRSRAQTLEALSKVEAGRDKVEGDRNARHVGCLLLLLFLLSLSDHRICYIEGCKARIVPGCNE